MRAAEMFAGIGGFRLALEQLGVETVWANDIDPKACRVYRTHFGQESITSGDIREVKPDIPAHNLLTAGFPCQPFSAAGKKMGIHDSVRGTLFAEVVDVLETRQPEFFILENVKRLLTMDHGKHFSTILQALTAAGYFVEWRLLNAKNFGLAQNRERLFIVGRREQTGILECDAKTFASTLSAVFLEGDSREECSLFSPPTLCELLSPISHHFRFGPAGFSSGQKAYSWEPKTLSHQKPPKLLRDILEPETEMCFDFTEVTNKWVKKNTEVNAFIHGVEILSNQDGGRRMGYTIFGIGGLSPTLTATPSRHYERYRIGDRYRRLTNIEYARLQGFADDWLKGETVYDQYALYGNAVPPAMVEWVAARLIERCRQAASEGFGGRDQASAASSCSSRA